MVETAAGERILLAPTDEIADFVSATYTFDRTTIGAVTVSITAGTGSRSRRRSWR